MLTRRSLIGGALGTALMPHLGLGANGPFQPDVEIELVAEQGEESIWDGPKTAVMRFRGRVLRGREDALRDSGSFLGPTLDFVRGEKVRIQFTNRLSEPTIVHWHGMIVPEAADGHPRLAIKPGEKYVYEFTVVNRAGTYWYHPHPHGRTGFQVYHGLGGVLIVRDPLENSIGLPPRTDEHVLAIQDRRVDGDHQFQYASQMMDHMMGILGDRILVNGKANRTLTVSRRPNRLRLLNLSNARLYKLAWADGAPMHIIGTDGGLLNASEGPRKVPFVVLGPAERVELWEDFSSRDSLQEVKLLSEEFTLKVSMGMGAGPGMGPGRGMGRGRGPGGMMGMMRGPGEKLEIATFRVADQPPEKGAQPQLLQEKTQQEDARRHVTTRIGFRMMRGFLNGRQWDMKDMSHTDRNERLRLNQLVDWTFDNVTEPGMSMPHPMHLHGVQFRILERKGTGAGDLAPGVIDVGVKDTVMVFSGDTLKIQFTPTVAGLFVYHCHNLEHEDTGMMRNFRVS
jgi:FtsP/CotA-like multicopper oxidase with cupredoxin domain